MHEPFDDNTPPGSSLRSPRSVFAAGVSRRVVLASSVAASGLLLEACVSQSTQPPAPLPVAAPPATPASLSIEAIGAGPVKLALLASKGGTGTVGVTGASMINAAKLAIAEFPRAQVTIAVYDSQGTNAGAQAAAQQAVTDGAQLILGPFFADEVRGAAPQARAANIPMIAFSSDPSVAQPGIFILGFLVQDEVRQLVMAAKAAGRRSLVAILQSSAYGTLAEGAMRQYASQAGMRLLPSAHVSNDPQMIQSAVQAVAAIKDQYDTIFLPDGAAIAVPVASQLAAAGVDFSRVQLMGSGQWNDPATYSNPALAGGWFPAPDIAAYQAWAGRYRAMFGQEPFPKTTLIYDAVFLAAALAQKPAAAPFDPLVLTNAQGAISPVNGLFRLNLDGTNNRGLTIYQISRGGAPRVVVAAPRAFVGV